MRRFMRARRVRNLVVIFDESGLAFGDNHFLGIFSSIVNVDLLCLFSKAFMFSIIGRDDCICMYTYACYIVQAC